MSAAPTPILVAVDLVIRRGTEILFIERANAPFKGRVALPGGFVDPDETVEMAAIRELKEETGVEITKPKLIGVWSNPHRDPRGRVISVAYFCEVPEGTESICGDDARKTMWLTPDEAWKDDIAFDHRSILLTAINKFVKHEAVFA